MVLYIQKYTIDKIKIDFGNAFYYYFISKKKSNEYSLFAKQMVLFLKTDCTHFSYGMKTSNTHYEVKFYSVNPLFLTKLFLQKRTYSLTLRSIVIK